MFHIIPEPKELRFQDGVFDISGDLTLLVPQVLNQHAVQLADFLSERYGAHITIAYGHAIEIIISRISEFRNILILPFVHEKVEAYRIQVESDHIVIQAQDERGLFYGLQTFMQMVEDYRAVPTCEIIDWPDMEIRGIHFDLKGGMPTEEYLADMLREMARYKINTILMEYEDKLQYTSHPLLAAKSALSQQEIRNIVSIAKQYYVQLMPLLQSLGHAEYILKHEHYAHLRESNDWYQQMCPCNPATFELFRDLFQELIHLHPHSVYFHIGGDETCQLGECPQCKRIAEEHGKYVLYADYISKVCRYVLECGKIPVIWDDMFTRHARQLLNKLPRETVFMYWNYRFTRGTMATVEGQEGTMISTQWLRKENRRDPGIVSYVAKLLEDAPQDEQYFIEAYGGSEQFPAEINSTIFLQYIQDQGFKVIGASAAQMMRDTILADPERALPNMMEWSRSVVKHQALGVIATGWTRNNGMDPLNGLMEGMKYEFIAAGEYCWSSEATTIDAFDLKFNKRCYGIDSASSFSAQLSVTDAIWLIRHQHRLPATMSLQKLFYHFADHAEFNRRNLLYYGYMAEQFNLQNMMEELMLQLSKVMYMRRYFVLPDRVKRNFEARVEAAITLIEKNEQDGREIFKLLLHPEEMDDVLHSLIDWHKERILFSQV